MDTKKLRQKILDLAIHGKLVPQDPNDEPASVLLERIRAEKERLIKEGKIKKKRASKKSASSTDTPHYENEDMPFELPKGWEWTTIGDIFNLQAGKNKTSKEISSIPDNIRKYPCFGGNGIRGYVDDFNREGVFPIIGRQGALCGNINIAKGKFYATEHAVVVEIYAGIQSMWAYYVLTQMNLNQYATATAQPGLSVATISDLPIALPPLNEQERISTEINKWFKLINIIEDGKIELREIIEQAKSKVLDLAIHGKLVPQNPNDEPAIELLRKINSKFQPCDKEHYPFMIPSNWCWGSIKDIVKPMVKSKPCNKTFKYIDIDSINNKKNICQPKIINTEKAPSRATRYTQKNDVLFSMVRPYLRNISLVAEDECIASTGFYVCSPHDGIESKYLFYLMISSYVVNGLNTYMKGDNSPSINVSDVDKFYIPIPPIKEQLRIVSKIDILFNQLDLISQTLAD